MVITEQTFSWKYPSFLGYLPVFASLKKIRHFMGTTHLKLAPGDLTHGWRSKSDDWLAEQYQKHNAHVQANVKKENLLVFNVKEGWEPLCKFLGKEVPNEEPFPNVQINTTSALLGLRRTFNLVVYLWIPTTLSIVAAICYFWRRNGRGATTRVGSGNYNGSSFLEVFPTALFPRARRSTRDLQ